MTQVVIRVRPPLPREVEGERMFQNIVSVDKEEHVITISENLNAILDEVGGSIRSAGGAASGHFLEGTSFFSAQFLSWIPVSLRVQDEVCGSFGWREPRGNILFEAEASFLLSRILKGYLRFRSD